MSAAIIEDYSMALVIPKNTATAAERRIPFTLVDATDLLTPKDITVTGVKMQLSFNGGTFAASTNDIVKVSGTYGEYYCELTQAESNNAIGIVRGAIQPSTCALTKASAILGPSDSLTVGATSAEIADASRDDAIQMLVDGIAMSSGDGTGTMTVKDSTGATVTITITRGAANPILSLT